MIRAYIIEDESLSAAKLQKQLEEVSPDVSIENILSSVEEAVHVLTQDALPDLIFLDIQLGDGLGLDIFKEIQADIPVIFTTAYSQYAIEAFKQCSVDYLLKPIDMDALAASIDKFKRLFAKKASPDINWEKLNVLLQGEQQQYKQRFLVQAGNKMLPMSAKEVAYFYAEDKIVWLVNKAARRYVVNYSLEKLEAILDPAHFYRVNRKLILANDALQAVRQLERSRLSLEIHPKPNFEVAISAEKSVAFKKWLQQEI